MKSSRRPRIFAAHIQRLGPFGPDAEWLMEKVRPLFYRALISLWLIFCLAPPAAAMGDDDALRPLRAARGLFHALAQSDLDRFGLLLDQGAPVNFPLDFLGLDARAVFSQKAGPPEIDADGWSLLSWAAYLGETRAIDLLAQVGAPLDGRDEYGATALFWTTWGGGPAAAQKLLAHGASCQIEDLKGRSPKDWAIMTGKAPLIKLFSGPVCRPPYLADGDQDGVADEDDFCPNTPLGAQVDERGCWLAAPADFAQNGKVKAQYENYLNRCGRLIKSRPDLKLFLEMHCLEKTISPLKKKEYLALGQLLSNYWEAGGFLKGRLETRLIPFNEKSSAVSPLFGRTLRIYLNPSETFLEEAP